MKDRKISFLSSIIMVISGTVGAGIFFKNKELASFAHGNMFLVVAIWILSAIAIVLLGLALAEVVIFKNKTSGVIGWAARFCPQWFTKSIKFFLRFFYAPIIIFAVSLYTISAIFQDSWKIDSPWVLLAIAFSLFLFFMLINLWSLKIAESAQWITTTIQLIALIGIPCLAIVQAFLSPLGNDVWQKNVTPPVGTSGIGSFMIFLIGLPSILFTFDGFYSIGAVSDKLEKPKSLNKTLVFGILAIVLIYLFITFTFIFGSRDGSPFAIDFIKDKAWLQKFFNISIAIGILGILNGHMLSILHQTKTLLTSGSVNDLSWFHKFLYKTDPSITDDKKHFTTAWLFLLIKTTLYFLFFGVIGIYLFKIQTNWPDEAFGPMGRMYQLADLMLNYLSLLMFVVLDSIILFALFGKYKERVQFKNRKLFLFTGIASSFFMFSSFLIMFSINIIDFFQSYETEIVILNIIKFILLFLFVGVSLLVGYLSYKMDKKHKLNVAK